MATVRPPSSTCSEATSARLGTRSVRSGAITASLTASRPTRIVPSSSTHTSDGTYFEPSISRTSVRPSASVAVVVNEVPKSIARSQPVTPSRRPSRRRRAARGRGRPGRHRDRRRRARRRRRAAGSSAGSSAGVLGGPVLGGVDLPVRVLGHVAHHDGEHVLPHGVGQLGVVDRERRGEQAVVVGREHGVRVGVGVARHVQPRALAPGVLRPPSCDTVTTTPLGRRAAASRAARRSPSVRCGGAGGPRPRPCGGPRRSSRSPGSSRARRGSR